jgi:O-antigen/teichoic acid export membrane protein
MNTKKNIASNALLSAISHIFARGSLVFASIILARSLPTEQFAAFSYYQLTVAMIGAYAALGLGVTSSRFFAEVGHEVEPSDVKPLGSLFSISLVVSMVAALAVFAIPERWLIADLDVPKNLLAAGVAATAVGVVPAGALRGLERYRTVLATSLAYGLIVIVSAVYASYKQAPELAMGSLVVAAMAKAALQSMAVVRVVGWRRVCSHLWPTGEDVEWVMRFAGPMFLVTLLSASGSWVVGRLILHSESGLRDFSLYAIGLQWYALGLLVPGMVAQVLLPRVVRMSANQHRETGSIVRFSGMLAVGASIVVTLLAVVGWPFLNHLYGVEYQIGSAFIAAYMVAAIFNAPANTFGNALVAHNCQWQWFLLIVIWFVTVIIAAWVFLSIGPHLVIHNSLSITWPPDGPLANS